VLWACCVRLHPTPAAPLPKSPDEGGIAAVTERRHRRARAYRDGVLICGRVDLTISLDARLGLAPRERRQLIARFVERLAPTFRRELEQLARRRGAGAKRAGDRFDSIELVFDDPQREGQRLVARIEPPQWRRWELSENEFVIREHL
jgi:hypothetical protein